MTIFRHLYELGYTIYCCIYVYKVSDYLLQLLILYSLWECSYLHSMSNTIISIVYCFFSHIDVTICQLFNHCHADFFIQLLPLKLFFFFFPVKAESAAARVNTQIIFCLANVTLSTAINQYHYLTCLLYIYPDSTSWAFRMALSLFLCHA